MMGIAVPSTAPFITYLNPNRVPGMAGVLILKVGTLDDPSVFGAPEMAIFAIDRQSFHHLPEGVPAFERGPGSTPVS